MNERDIINEAFLAAEIASLHRWLHWYNCALKSPWSNSKLVSIENSASMVVFQARECAHYYNILHPYKEANDTDTR